MATDLTTSATSQVVNVASRLSEHARARPDQVAVVEPLRRRRDGNYQYRQVTFTELERDSNRLANGLRELGVEKGTRLALLVRPGIDFVSLVFALFKAEAVAILIDPGMGRGNLVRCLGEADPEGFVAIPVAHAIRTVLRRHFPRSRFHVTVGRRWFWGGVTIDQLRQLGSPQAPQLTTRGDDPAAIIFTTGSTGPPKGVLYRQANFDNQVTQIRDQYGIAPGETDLAAFPLFGLFNGGMGVTTIVPDMDATRPADADPLKIIQHINDWQVTQSFGSPAFWNRVGQYCEENAIALPSLRRVFSAGAPVPGHVLARLKKCLPPDAEIHTPYGATEALPVATISAREVLEETQTATDRGCGVCVGKNYSGIDWQVIEIVDGPIASIADATPLATGEIGELIVRGPVVTDQYATRPDANRLGKIAEGDTTWHRMGDVGHMDNMGRFWFCGRLAHRVQTADGTLFTIPVEAVFNTHEAVFRSALVGVGPAGQQKPVLVVEPLPEHFPNSTEQRELLRRQLCEVGKCHPHTERIRDMLFHPSLPVDIRHNAKIFREKLAVWAAGQIGD